MEDQAPYGKGEEIKLQRFFGYSYTDKILVEGFDPGKYKKIMNIENTHYVYDQEGIMLAMICGKTREEAIWECKKYILIKRFNLVHYKNADYDRC